MVEKTYSMGLYGLEAFPRLFFEAGLQLKIPILPAQPPSTLPPWKRGSAS